MERIERFDCEFAEGLELPEDRIGLSRTVTGSDYGPACAILAETGADLAVTRWTDGRGKPASAQEIGRRRSP